MRKLTLLFLALALAATGHAQTITGTSGTLYAPTQIGALITVSNVQTSAGPADITCPVTAFGASTYQWKWQCAGGVLSVNGVAVASLAGSMILTCSGGGRTHVTTCWHQLQATATAADGSSGAVSVTSKGSTNNAVSTVTAFTASW